MEQTRLLDELMTIDVDFDFTTDTEGYWELHEGTDLSICPTDAPDPDTKSRTLREYHRILWSRELPNGEAMLLENAPRFQDYLMWDGHRFGSDSIVQTYRRNSMSAVFSELRGDIPDFRSFMERIIRKMYTIGAMMMFPKHDALNGRRTDTFNQARGKRNNGIEDRWDRSLECIRLHYLGMESPLSETLEEDSWYYDKFVDFRGFVDFFFLQDCVDGDYNVVPWANNLDFDTNPLPENPEEYIRFIDAELTFTERRNRRIAKFVEGRRRQGPPSDRIAIAPCPIPRCLAFR